MTLADIKAMLLTVTKDTSHYIATKKPDKYIVWAEDGQVKATFSDNKMKSQAIQGTIDYFTKMEFDPNFDLIQSKMNSINLHWKLNSVQHEEETGYIHYEWVWEVENRLS